MTQQVAATVSPKDVFPDFDPTVKVAESSGALFRAEFGEWWGRNKMKTVIWLLVFAVIALGGLSVGHIWPLIIVSIVPVVFAIGIWYRISKRSTVQYWRSYAKSRGLQLDDSNPRINCDIPLFCKGDKRRFDRVLAGSIGGEARALGHFTYTEVSTDGKGNRTETPYPFTVCAMRLPDPVAARYQGVYCRKKSMSLGALQDKLFKDRSVELESTLFHKRYSLRVLDDQDDIALYELFSPTFIDQLSESYCAYWEQQGADLVVFQPKHLSDTTDLDAFCADAIRVYRRYAEEYQ